jgi:hypothetical protein
MAVKSFNDLISDISVLLANYNYQMAVCGIIVMDAIVQIVDASNGMDYNKYNNN